MYRMLKVMVQNKRICWAKPLKQLSNFITKGAGGRTKLFYGVGLSAGVITNFYGEQHDKV